MTHSCELEDFSSQVFKDCSHVDGSLGSNAHLILGVVLEETLDTTAGELENHMLACGRSKNTQRMKYVNVFGKVGGWEEIDSCIRGGRSIVDTGGASQSSKSKMKDPRIPTDRMMVVDVAHRMERSKSVSWKVLLLLMVITRHGGVCRR
jgi:hypothetical protein